MRLQMDTKQGIKPSQRLLIAALAVWSRARGKPTLRLAVRGEKMRQWRRQILAKLVALPNCNSVGSLQA